MPSPRTARVSRQILQDLSEIIEREVKDPRVGRITLTSVQTTPDLRSAKVYFSRMGAPAEREEARRVLDHAAGFLRCELGARLRLRYVPELRFYIDDSLDVSERINRLLDRDRPADEERRRDE
jgi:ribosome-binding factor A